MSQFYVGVKQVFAFPESAVRPDAEGKPVDTPGYHVVYDYQTPREYHSWAPKDVFEAAYLPMGRDAGNGTRVTAQMVVAMSGLPPLVSKLGGQTAVAQATLATGFELTEVSACVDPANFDLERGGDLAKDKIARQVWHLLGFVLGWARNGLRR